MMNSTGRWILCVAVSLCLTTASVSAATWTGLGASGDMSDKDNWEDGLLPSSTGEDLVFGSAGNWSTLNNDHFTSVNSITFSAGADSFIINGTAIAFPSGGTRLVNESNTTQTISLALSGGGQTIFSGIGADSHTYLTGDLSGFWMLQFTRVDAPAPQFVISGNNTHTITDQGAARVRIAGTNALGTGNFVINSGIGGVVNETGGTLTVGNTLELRHRISFHGNHSMVFDGGGIFLHRDGRFNLELNDPTASLTFVGGEFEYRMDGLEEPGWTARRETPLNKTGVGTLVLQDLDFINPGAGHWYGGFNINAGTLVMNSDTGHNWGDVNVAAGAVLAGDGVFGGDTTITGSLRPGNSIGTMTVASDVTWTGQGAEGTDDWVFELGAENASDLLDITDGAFLKGDGSNFIFDFADANNTGTFTLVQWTSTEDLSGGALGTSFQLVDFSYTGLDEEEFEGSYFGFSGQSLTFTVIPEPGSFALLLAGCAFVAIARRRRG